MPFSDQAMVFSEQAMVFSDQAMVFFDQVEENKEILPQPKKEERKWKNKAQKKRATTLHELWRIEKYV